MRLPLAAALAAAALLAPAANAFAAEPVNIQFDAFAPSELDVLPGETVEWTNISERSHTVTADDETFDSGDIEAGDRFERTFDAVGSYDYHCRIHPGMVGELDGPIDALHRRRLGVLDAGQLQTLIGLLARLREEG